MGRPKGSTSKKPNNYWSKEAKHEYVQLIMEGEISMSELSRKNGME